MTGALARPFVIDSAGERYLFFTYENVQSCMRLDDPYALVAAYTRKMTAFLLFLPEPRHILMIGLGGGSLAKFCYRHLPQTRITVVEINADVISLREHFSIPADDERFEIIHDDGATYLARVPPKVDAILVDAFDESGVASSPTRARSIRCMYLRRINIIDTDPITDCEDLALSRRAELYWHAPALARLPLHGAGEVRRSERDALTRRCTAAGSAAAASQAGSSRTGWAPSRT